MDRGAGRHRGELDDEIWFVAGEQIHVGCQANPMLQARRVQLVPPRGGEPMAHARARGCQMAEPSDGVVAKLLLPERKRAIGIEAGAGHGISKAELKAGKGDEEQGLVAEFGRNASRQSVERCGEFGAIGGNVVSGNVAQ